MLTGCYPHVLVCGPSRSKAEIVRDLLHKQGLPDHCVRSDPAPVSPSLQFVDVLVCVLDQDSPALEVERATTLLEQARERHITALVWGMPSSVPTIEGELIDRVPDDIGPAEVTGRLTVLARYAPIIKRMETELDRLQRLGNHLNRYFSEIDHELRLAGRLQQDFLPRSYPETDRVTFSCLYRPATWVSGDIYDVFAIDDRRIGLFIADAMGHGTAAGLMSLFLRRTLVPVRGRGAEARIVPPCEAMAELHEALVRQDLPHAQFVTAAYAILDSQDLTLRLARGGHPYPLRIAADGRISELRCEGGLLGVAGLESDFEDYRCTLDPGDKIVFYTDGLEELFIVDRDEDNDHVEYGKLLRKWAPLPADRFVEALAAYLDKSEGSLNPEDDVTVVVAAATPQG